MGTRSTPQPNEAELLGTGIRTAAAEAECHVVAASLHIERPTQPTVNLTADEIISLVAAVRPPIVYVLETATDALTEIEVAQEAAGVQASDRSYSEIARAGRRLASHDGKAGRVSVEVMMEGVLHRTYAAAPWIIEFDHRVEAIEARVAEEMAAGRDDASKAATLHVRELARRLMADPAFDSGRPSYAKRRFLAGELFPDEDGRILDAATETAEHMRWVAAGRD